MEYNFGSERATYETKMGRIVKYRVWGVILLLILVAAGLFFLLNPVDAEDVVMGWVSVGAGVIICTVLFVISSRIRSKAVIYDEGVVITNRGVEHKFHFNEIAGLRGMMVADTSDGVTVAGGVAGGLIGGLIAGAIAGAMANNRESEMRPMVSVRIVPNTNSMDEVTVMNEAGDELSLLYTQWIIQQKGITKENVNTLNMSFGDELELYNGAITSKQRRKEVTLELSKITKIDSSSNGVTLQFFGMNEKGKEKNLLSIGIIKVNNVHLLLEIHNMITASQKLASDTISASKP